MTDSGLIVPVVSLQLRERLMSAMSKHGISSERQAETIGRAATELAIHLLGGQHRLNPSNMHQVPTAVFLCGTSSVASLGLAAARHLASHGVKTQVLTNQNTALCVIDQSHGRCISQTKLPSIPADWRLS